MKNRNENYQRRVVKEVDPNKCKRIFILFYLICWLLNIVFFAIGSRDSTFFRVLSVKKFRGLFISTPIFMNLGFYLILHCLLVFEIFVGILFCLVMLYVFATTLIIYISSKKDEFYAPLYVGFTYAIMGLCFLQIFVFGFSVYKFRRRFKQSQLFRFSDDQEIFNCYKIRRKIVLIGRVTYGFFISKLYICWIGIGGYVWLIQKCVNAISFLLFILYIQKFLLSKNAKIHKLFILFLRSVSMYNSVYIVLCLARVIGKNTGIICFITVSLGQSIGFNSLIYYTNLNIKKVKIEIEKDIIYRIFL